jgi:hypothetical protein
VDLGTAAIAAIAASISVGHTLKLSVVHHKYAAQITAHACSFERHEHKLVLLHAKNKAKAIAIAGPDYDEHHTISFEETASHNKQLCDTETTHGVLEVGFALLAFS